MRTGRIPGIDKPVSRIIQGTASLWSYDDEGALCNLDMALAHGINTFDSAENYGEKIERRLGEWIRSRGVREQVVTLHKGAHHYEGRHRVTPEDITADLTKSLTNTDLDYFDLYVLHRDDPSYPVGPIVEALNEHVRRGRIRAFGGSNWSHERLREANAYATEHGLVPFVASSPHYSLAEMLKAPWENAISISGPQGEAARAYYAETGMAVCPWSSLSSGFFSGRFRRDNLDDPGFDAYWDKVVLTCYASEENFQRLDRAAALAGEKGVTAAQIALAFLFNQPLAVYPIVFCHNEEQFAANVAATDITLTREEMDWLDLKREER